MCYVGKATKIFFFLVGALMLVGLVVGFGLLRHGGSRKVPAQSCESSAAGCRPVFPDPLPADANSTPAVVPADVTATPTSTPTPSGPASTATTTPPPPPPPPTPPAPTSSTPSTAVPPAYALGPPSPISSALGPAHA